MKIGAAIARGVADGIQQTGESLRQVKEDERKEKRFKWEEEDQNERQRTRDAQKEWASGLESLRRERATGMLLGEDQLTDQGRQFRQQAVQPRTALQTPGAEGQADFQAVAEERTQDIFKSGGEGLYANQQAADEVYYSRLRDLTARYLEQTGQVDKLMDLDKQINTMRDAGYEPIRKAAAAAIVTGQPGAMKLVSRATELTGTNNFKIDPDSGQYDDKAMVWKGVRIVGPDGKAQVKDIPAQNLLAAISQVDPTKLLEFTYGRQDADRKFGLEQRQVAAQETQAGAAMVRATADRDRLTAEQKAGDIKSRNETLSAMFPNANRELKTEDMLGRSDAEVKQLRDSIARDNANLTKAQAVSALNPRLDPRIAAQIVRNPGAYQVVGQDGERPYTMVGTQKVYLR